MKSKRVNVTNVPTLLLDQGGKDASVSVGVKNPSASVIDVGDATVASGAGWEIAAGDRDTFDLHTGDKLYAIVASGSVSIEVIWTSNT